MGIVGAVVACVGTVVSLVCAEDEPLGAVDVLPDGSVEPVGSPDAVVPPTSVEPVGSKLSVEPVGSVISVESVESVLSVDSVVPKS